MPDLDLQPGSEVQCLVDEEWQDCIVVSASPDEGYAIVSLSKESHCVFFEDVRPKHVVSVTAPVLPPPSPSAAPFFVADLAPVIMGTLVTWLAKGSQLAVGSKTLNLLVSEAKQFNAAKLGNSGKHTVIISHEACVKHRIYDNPDCPGRVVAVLDNIKKHFPGCTVLESSAATGDQLRRFHSTEHVDKIMDLFTRAEEKAEAAEQDNVNAGEGEEKLTRNQKKRAKKRLEQKAQELEVTLDKDTGAMAHTRQAVLCSAGACIQAVDLVMRGEARNAFCVVRPPGHHATPTQAMGFCFVNNVAVAAHHAKEYYGLERVAVVDIDVHHGNGTQVSFGSL
jgi:hypothetical protein